MSEKEIVDFTARRLRKSAIQYTVVIRHDENGMSFMVNDIQDTEKDRLAVAKDLEAAAQSLIGGVTSS
jgi:hypothetical protein